ncbi:MAG: hypothetical protein sL5_05850 [Candidatus Mesenet longicola]|uniref:Type IV secretion system protein n=1 Tax=Candidatus Mesenet longicola TaxID=1892558 RepID=A0A8J3MQI6_9RICK|nr:MAG: hypothetical protein sGL2_05780 [Candidatus Mesenet longicola]GHM59592.1 MAG: hypothetical protein sL5_05850 [Candidatus Mesenet longicola]
MVTSQMKYQVIENLVNNKMKECLSYIVKFINNGYSFFLLRVLLILVLLLEIGCEPISPFPRCISADNFGLEAVTASAYYPKDSEAFKAKDGENTAVFSPNQVVRWVDTGLVTNGEPIKVRTNGMWTSWAKSNKKYTPAAGIITLSDTENGKDKPIHQSIIPLDRICGPYSIKDSTIPGCSGNKCQYIDESLKDDIKKGAYGAPCWFRNGYGAYLLLKRDGDPDPNDNVDIMRSPRSPVVHLGYKSADEGGSGAFSSIEHPIKDASCQNVELQPGWKVYIKILDRYYWDNAGGYAFEFISGVRQERGLMIFETIRKKVKEILITQGGEAIFKRIVENNSYKNLVHSLLVLFLMISALLYILGMIQQPMPDFLVRALKISLVLMLISPNSWQFFYDNFLSLFINGTDAIIGMINGHSGMRSYNQEAPFAFLDYMIRDKIFSPIVWGIKMRALIVSDFLGIFGVLFIIVIVLIYVFLCIYAFAIYLAGLIGISLLIALMPIFFVGILFSKLKPLFDGWLTQCISFSLQSIMIFTLLSLFGSLIMNTYYRLLGFTVCYNKWMEVKLPPIPKKSLYDWTPGQKYVPKVINIFGKSNACDSLNCSYDSVSRFTFTGGGAVIPVPPEYTEKDFRYIDYPYFDPDITGNKNPDGISVQENSRFTELANLLNSLMALPTVNGDAIARLVEDIKSEIKRLGLGNSSQFSQIEDSQNNNIPSNYGQLQYDVKSALISLIGSDITDPTPKEELEKQYDYSIIKKIRKGYLIIWEELLILLLLAFLISLMRSFVTNVGSSLGGGSHMSTMLSGVWDGFFHPYSGGVGGKIGQFFSELKHSFWQDKIGGGIEKIGDAVANTVKRTPILGTAVKFTSEVTDAITTPDSADAMIVPDPAKFKFQKKFNKQLKKLTYYRAVVGSHLSYSGFDALKHLGKYTVDKISGEKETELWKDVKLQHNHFMQKLREEILGPEKDKLSPYLPPKDPADEESPFPRITNISGLDDENVDRDIDDVERSIASDEDISRDVRRSQDFVQHEVSLDEDKARLNDDIDVRGVLHVDERSIDNDIQHPTTSGEDIGRNAVQDFDQHEIRLNEDRNLELREDRNNELNRDIHNQLLREKMDQYNEGTSDSRLELRTGDSDYPDYTSEEISRGTTSDIATDETTLSDVDYQTDQDNESLSPQEEVEVPRDDSQFQTSAYKENLEELEESYSDKGEIQSVIQDHKTPQDESLQKISEADSYKEIEPNIADDDNLQDSEISENMPQTDSQSLKNLVAEDYINSEQLYVDDKLENNEQELLQSNDQTVVDQKSSSEQKKGITTKEKLDELKKGQNKRKEIEVLQDKIKQIKEQQEDNRDES